MDFHQRQYIRRTIYATREQGLLSALSGDVSELTVYLMALMRGWQPRWADRERSRRRPDLSIVRDETEEWLQVKTMGWFNTHENKRWGCDIRTSSGGRVGPNGQRQRTAYLPGLFDAYAIVDQHRGVVWLVPEKQLRECNSIMETALFRELAECRLKVFDSTGVVAVGDNGMAVVQNPQTALRFTSEQFNITTQELHQRRGKKAMQPVPRECDHDAAGPRCSSVRDKGRRKKMKQ